MEPVDSPPVLPAICQEIPAPREEATRCFAFSATYSGLYYYTTHSLSINWTTGLFWNFYHRETEAGERRDAKVEAASSRFEDGGHAGGEATGSCLGHAPPASVGQNLMAYGVGERSTLATKPIVRLRSLCAAGPARPLRRCDRRRVAECGEEKEGPTMAQINRGDIRPGDGSAPRGAEVDKAVLLYGR